MLIRPQSMLRSLRLGFRRGIGGPIGLRLLTLIPLEVPRHAAAELHTDIDAANRAAERRGIPIRFVPAGGE